MTIQFNMRMPADLRKQMQREAKKLRISDATFVRRLIVLYFEEQEIQRAYDAEEQRKGQRTS